MFPFFLQISLWIKPLIPQPDHQLNEQSNQLVRGVKEDRRQKHHHKNSNGTDRGFLAGRPGDFLCFSPHLAVIFNGVQHCFTLQSMSFSGQGSYRGKCRGETKQIVWRYCFVLQPQAAVQHKIREKPLEKRCFAAKAALIPVQTTCGATKCTPIIRSNVGTGHPSPLRRAETTARAAAISSTFNVTGWPLVRENCSSKPTAP